MKKTLLILSLLILTSCQSGDGIIHYEYSSGSSSSIVSASSMFSFAEESSSSRSFANRTDYGPISFSTDGMDVVVHKKIKPIPREDMDSLIQDAADCGPKREKGYFEKLAAIYKNTDEIEYTVAFREYPESAIKIILIPNKMHYPDSNAFSEDFFRCGAGGEMPRIAGKKWLVFADSCGGSGESTREFFVLNYHCSLFEQDLIPSIIVQ